MRKAKIYYDDYLTGHLTEMDDGDYVFEYTPGYVENFEDRPITLTMPVRKEKFIERRLFPFFEGLIPEGWLLNIASKNWKLKKEDRMGLLLACCHNCIGAVSVQPTSESDEK